MAARILNQNGDTKALGKVWVAGYFKRNPHIKSMLAQLIESA